MILWKPEFMVVSVFVDLTMVVSAALRVWIVYRLLGRVSSNLHFRVADVLLDLVLNALDRIEHRGDLAVRLIRLLNVKLVHAREGARKRNLWLRTWIIVITIFSHKRVRRRPLWEMLVKLLSDLLTLLTAFTLSFVDELLHLWLQYLVLVFEVELRRYHIDIIDNFLLIRLLS